MDKKWTRGHVNRFWSADDYRNFEYIRQSVTDEEYGDWVGQGYDYVKSFTGSMYDNRNPMPEWVNRFDSIFNLKNLTYTFYKMKTLEIMPVHVDHFRTYMRLMDVEYKSVKRILVMLEDWKPGHYLEIDGMGIVNWIAGDWFMWDSDVPHAASNIGIEDRYTLQITGTAIQSEEIWKNIHWYNIIDLPTKKESMYSGQMHKAVDSLANNNGKPFFIYMHNGTIKDLETIKHTPESVDSLNKTGVDVYLYEPLCSYLDSTPVFYPPHGTKHTMEFYSEFHYDHVNKNPNDVRAEELDSIQRYAENNSLTDVTVYTCDYGIENYYKFYDKLKLKTNDIFLKTFNSAEFEPLTESDEPINFSKRFICLNWRYSLHRQIVAAYLATLPDRYITWYFRSDLANVAREPWIDLFEWSQTEPRLFDRMLTGFRDLNNRGPFALDLTNVETTTFNHPYFRNVFPGGEVIYEHKTSEKGDNIDRLKKYYNDVFCDIVTESRFAQPTANFSEKTLRPMFYKKPFVMVGPPHTLRYLKEEGFKTFSDFWDESYDLDENHQTRLIKILNIIDFIQSKSILDLQKMYKDMSDIIEHNYNLALTKYPICE